MVITDIWPKPVAKVDMATKEKQDRENNLIRLRTQLEAERVKLTPQMQFNFNQE